MAVSAGGGVGVSVAAGAASEVLAIDEPESMDGMSAPESETLSVMDGSTGAFFPPHAMATAKGARTSRNLMVRISVYLSGAHLYPLCRANSNKMSRAAGPERFRTVVPFWAKARHRASSELGLCFLLFQLIHHDQAMARVLLIHLPASLSGAFGRS